MEELTITVNIADRPYRLKIRKDEEVSIRNAVAEIDLRIRDYANNFAFNDKQDLMAMVLLHYASTVQKLESDLSAGELGIVARLTDLEQIIAGQLS